MTAGAAQAVERPAVKIIFDTDMWGDIDDMLALAMLHSLQNRGEVELLAVTSSTDEKSIVSYIDAFNSYFGHGTIPIGMVSNGVTGDETARKYPPIVRQRNYTHYVSKLRKSDGRYLFPRAPRGGSKPPEAVALLRKVLAAQPDNSVVFVQVGFSTNLARLLDSKPDAASPFNGRELVKRKARLLSVMAGNFGDKNGKLLDHSNPEFNLSLDVTSAQRLFSNWPTPIVASGFEIGFSMWFRGRNIDSKFAYDQNHPVSVTYRYTDPIYRPQKWPAGELHDHATFDLTSVLYAGRPDDGYFSLSEPGRISVEADGRSRFMPDADGRHRYLVVNEAQRSKALEAMTSLASEPPLRSERGRLRRPERN
jgi:purine nucleosidase